MEKDIVDGKIGELGSYDVEFKGGKLLAKAGIAKAGVSGSVEIAIDSDVILDALKAAVPGQIDDVLIDLVKAALKA